MRAIGRRPPKGDASVSTLSVDGLSVYYGGVCAVSGVSFTVEPGQSVGIIGANGAGKTSTLKALLGLVRRSSGQVRLGDVDLGRVPARDMVRHGIGYVPEGRHVFAGLSVEHNLLLGAYTTHWRTQTREPLDEVYELFPALSPVGNSRCSRSAARSCRGHDCYCSTSRPWGSVQSSSTTCCGCCCGYAKRG